jgi:hypothetical protein
MAVVGGLALAAWKHVRATRDIDLLLGIAPEDLEPVFERLAAAGIRLKQGASPTSLGPLNVLQFVYEPPESLMELQIDLLLADSPYHRVALERSVPTRLPELDIEVRVLACEDLILHKLLAGRMIDLADAAALLRANRDTLDLDYLNRWAASLEVDRQRELARAWKDAFSERPT